jgi:hypothetical protein
MRKDGGAGGFGFNKTAVDPKAGMKPKQSANEDQEMSQAK